MGLLPGKKRLVGVSGKNKTYRIGLPNDFGRKHEGKELTPLYTDDIIIFCTENKINTMLLKFS